MGAFLFVFEPHSPATPVEEHVCGKMRGEFTMNPHFQSVAQGPIVRVE